MNQRQIQIWSRLKTCSRRAIRRTVKKYGKPYFYKPRGDLLLHLSQEFGITIDQAYMDLMEIRAWRIKMDQG